MERLEHSTRRWWESYFGADYAVLYEFRNEDTARECEFVCRELGLKPGMRVLDACCGHGRHMSHLLAKQLRAVGVDLEPVQLAQARARLGARQQPAPLVRGDVRFLPFGQAFDAVLSLFTSFGYFDDETNAHVLCEMHRVLRRGGQLLIDLPNTVASYRRGFPPHWVRRDNATIMESFERDAATGRLHSTKIVSDERGQREYRFSLREYTLPELQRLLEAASFEVTRVWGGYDGSAFTSHAHRLLVCARRSEKS